MPDPAPTGVTVPVPTGNEVGGSGQTEFKVPDGKMLIDASEHQTWQRQREQLAGLSKFHGEASKRGFKSPQDFGRFDKFDSTIKGRKLTMEQVTELLAAEGEDTAQGSGADLEAFEKKFADRFVPKDQLNKELDLRDARHEHKQLLAKEQDYIAKAKSSLIGADASPRDKFLIERAIKAEIADAKLKSIYADDSPMRFEDYKPLTEKDIESIVATVKKELGIADGAELEQIGKAAAKGTTTPAGGGTSLGKSKQEDDPHEPMSERVRRSIASAKATGG